MKRRTIFYTAVLAALLAGVLTAWGQGGLQYIDDAGVTQAAPSGVTVITAANIGSYRTLSAGWYSIRGVVDADGTIKVDGDVFLILEDGSHLTAAGTDGRAGIEVPTGKSLTVYAQSAGANAGRITATGGPFGGAGIGSAVSKRNVGGVDKGQFFDARDGKMYVYVTITGGNGYSKDWMAENLNHQTDESWCYDDDKSNCDKYGRLYTWEAAMNGSSSSSLNPSGVQGVCPDGWHLPSDAEWTALVNAVGDPAGTKLKSTSGWNSGYNGTDDFGFSALPGGFRFSNGGFNYAGYDGYWWSATEYDAYGAWYRDMSYVNDYVFRDGWVKTNALSVRCLRD